MKNLPKDHPPICADCRHYITPGRMQLPISRCSRFHDIVDGCPMFCNLLRKSECGVEGRYFEPKPKKKPNKGFWKKLLETLGASPIE